MMNNRTRSSSRKLRGFNLLEVMMAVGIITVGAVGMVGMQRASIVGNADARQMAMGTALAQRWVEVLRRDAYLWQAATVAGLDNTSYLKTGLSAANQGKWIELAPLALDSTRYDYNGTGVASTGTGAHYCVNVRLQWIYTDSAARADVRVWWPRTLASINTTATNSISTLANCAETNLDTVTAHRNARIVGVSTVIRWTPGP